MTSLRSDFLQTLSERGFIHQCTDLEGLDARLMDSQTTGYIGFDATADSLHAGSLVPIMMLAHLQRTGHRPLVLMGGATSRIGDPSGKDEARQLLSREEIDQNIRGISKVFSKVLDMDQALLLNNDDWLSSLNYLEMLRDYGRHFSINRMLTLDSVRLRLEREQPLSFLEFNYAILQAYDFAYLAKEHQCVFQMGGSDQWGNIINGVELGRRVSQQTLFGLTAPLLATASGAKMGKTAAGAVWLNPDRLSAYDYWQYWRNTEDLDVVRFLKLFTFLPLEEIHRLGQLQGAELNEAKKILADEATSIVHGKESLAAIHKTVEGLFQRGALDVSALPLLEVIIPSEGYPLIRALVESGLVVSNSEARRLVRSQAVRWGDAPVSDENLKITVADFEGQEPKVLSVGKKKHAAVKPLLP